MPVFVALLRGINVSGQKKIAMADLREQLKDLGLGEVRTYIQSGNVVFSDARRKPAALADAIRGSIREAYDFEVPTLVVPAGDLARVRDLNPFQIERQEDPARCHVTFLHAVPAADRVDGFADVSFPPEEHILEDRFVYLFLPAGYGRAKLNNNYIEKKLGVAATTRNWKTVLALCEMAGV